MSLFFNLTLLVAGIESLVLQDGAKGLNTLMSKKALRLYIAVPEVIYFYVQSRVFDCGFIVQHFTP